MIKTVLFLDKRKRKIVFFDKKKYTEINLEDDVQIVYCRDNFLKFIIIPPSVEEIIVCGNRIKNINIDNNPKLDYLYLDNVKLTGKSHQSNTHLIFEC